jgi:hypothetical protein
VLGGRFSNDARDSHRKASGHDEQAGLVGAYGKHGAWRLEIALIAHGVPLKYVNAALGFVDAETAINNERPLIYELDFNEANTHVGVIAGHGKERNGVEWIYILDPYDLVFRNRRIVSIGPSRALVISLGGPHEVISWAIVNGGRRRAADVVWHQVLRSELGPEVDARAVVRKTLEHLGVPSAVGLLTARDVRRYEDARVERGDVWAARGQAALLSIPQRLQSRSRSA